MADMAHVSGLVAAGEYQHLTLINTSCVCLMIPGNCSLMVKL